MQLSNLITSCLPALHSGATLSGSSSSSGVDNLSSWKAEKDTSSLMKKNGGSPKPRGEEVFVWSGSFSSECYGNSVPVILARGKVPFSPKKTAELMMDSKIVKEYNKLSLGREDIKVFDEETKVVRNRSKPPLVSGEARVERVGAVFAAALKEFCPSTRRDRCPNQMPFTLSCKVSATTLTHK